MDESNTKSGLRPLRADARRNRKRLLEVTSDLILEVGGEPSRDAVAAAAGVGIATLYRHFPTRQDLLRAVVLDVLRRTIAAGQAALDEGEDGGTALRRYLHAAIDGGLGVVNIAYPLLDDTQWPDEQAAARCVLDRLAEAASRDQVVPEDFGATDIALTAIRFCRPLAVGMDLTAERAIAHRQLDHYLDGLALT